MNFAHPIFQRVETARVGSARTACRAGRCAILVKQHDTPAGLLSRAIDEMIIWSVYVLFLPLVLQDRWRRHRERQAGDAAGRDRAIRNLFRGLNTRLREIDREDASGKRLR